MKKAVDSAAKWLAEKVKANPKLNPIPYPFFKSIIGKQIEWAAKRGVSLDFEELSQAVRTELLKVGIYTMAESEKASNPKYDSTQAKASGAIPPLLIKFHSASEAMATTAIFEWLRKVFDKAHSEKYSGLSLTAEATQEGNNA